MPGRKKVGKVNKWSAAASKKIANPDLEKGVFTLRSAEEIAASLKRSAEKSKDRTNPYRWAMSVLSLYMNRAGRNVPAGRRRVLERTKGELRRQFGRPP